MSKEVFDDESKDIEFTIDRVVRSDDVGLRRLSLCINQESSNYDYYESDDIRFSK